jgi:SPP1 family phage portal protein
MTSEIQKKDKASYIAELIDRHQTTALPRLRRLHRYYMGEHDILSTCKEPGKPDFRLVNNFCKSITDCTVGYFMGVPVTYSSADRELEHHVCALSAYNDEAFADSVLARDLSVYGIAAELLWCDSDGVPRFTPIDVTTVIPVIKNDVEGELSGAVRYYVTAEGKMRAEYYDSDTVSVYEASEGTLHLISVKDHGYGGVPVNLYKNNSDMTGDFESVITLVDAYNTLQSESVNDFQLFADSYLAISGMGGTTAEDIERLRRSRVLLLDEGGSACWLTKPVNDAYIENLKSRIAGDIYRFSNTVDMSEETLGGSSLSGTAIRYRMLGFDNRVSVTRQYFKKGLMRRWELICELLGALGSGYDWRSIRVTFTKNMPDNPESAASLASSVEGMVSRRTQLELLPFVDSPEE